MNWVLIPSTVTGLPRDLVRFRYHNLIGGEWKKSSDGQRFDVIDPATER